MQEIAYSYIRDLGPGRSDGRTRSLGGAAGLESRVLGWNLAAYVSGAREVSGRTLSNRVQTTYLAEALGRTPDNPATPFSTAMDGFFNPYGDPTANSAAVLAFIGSGYTRVKNVSTVGSFNFKIDGTILDLPGGPLRMAAGVDVRRERFETEGENFTAGLTPRLTAPTSYERDVSAAFVELRAPIVGVENARPGIERLELSLAARIEDHQGVGRTTNPKVGLLYSPTSDLRLRASYGTSFRAPSLRELYTTYQLGPAFLNRNGANVLSVIRYGGNPDLDPETAESTTAGFVWTPAAADGFRLEAGWFRTRFDDRIGNPVSENVANALNDPTLAPFVRFVNPVSNAEDRALVQSLLDHPGNFNPNVFPATSYGAVIDNRFVNASRLEVEGVDISARYAFDLGPGEASVDGSITRLLRYDRELTETSPTEALVGTPNFPARWRGRIGGRWTSGPFTLGLNANHVSGGRDPVGGRGIDDWTTFDGQIRYDFAEGWGEGVSVTLDVINLANSEPPFYDSPSGYGYDAANTDIFGRRISLQLVKRW